MFTSDDDSHYLTPKAIVARFKYEYGYEYDLVWKKYLTKKSSMAKIW